MDWESIRPILPGLAMLVLLTVIFWLVVIRPTKKSQQAHLNLIETLAPGDRIVTVGGMYGKVRRVGEDSFDLEVAKDIVITFDRRAARRRLED
ncbi:MAG: preprotein translocase subunit YajC [Armatimonadota bacterium]